MKKCMAIGLLCLALIGTGTHSYGAAPLEVVQGTNQQLWGGGNAAAEVLPDGEDSYLVTIHFVQDGRYFELGGTKATLLRYLDQNMSRTRNSSVAASPMFTVEYMEKPE